MADPAEHSELDLDRGNEQPACPDMLFGFWYRALRGRKVRRGKMVAVTLVDTALVVGRDRRGRPFALLDACPHRGKPLSYGWFDGNVVQCSFHGWRFDAGTGQCRFVPSCTAEQRDKVTRLRAGHVPCEERDDFIWVYMQDPAHAGRRAMAPRPLRGPAPALPVYSEKYQRFCVSTEVPIGADHALISLMDPAHGPFVHRAWWTLARALFGAHEDESRVEIEPIPLGFREITVARIKERWSARLAGADTATIEVDFVLPHTRIGRFRFGRYWLSGLVTVTPITSDRCRIDQLVAWNALRFVPFVATVLKFVFWLFLIQDRDNLARQAEGLPRIRRLSLVGDSDRVARWYLQMKHAYLEARRTGGELEHPLRGPVTLRYRNPTVEDMR